MKNLLFFLVVFIISCTSNSNNMYEKVISKIDLQKYQGTWYEIARIPIKQEKDLYNVTAIYTLKEGKISVVNSGFNSEKERKSVKGKAWIPDPNVPGRLKVRFFWPFSSDYLILYVDDKYEKALVSGKNAKYAWILSKSSEMNDADFEMIIKIAKDKGVDVSKFELVKQEWD